MNKLFEQETEKKRIEEIIEKKYNINITVVALNNLKVNTEVLKV